MESQSNIALLINAAISTATLFSGFASMGMSTPPPVRSATETGLSSEARAALSTLESQIPAAASLNQSAKGVLVFPKVTKGGFLVSAFYGEGVMFRQGRISGHIYGFIFDQKGLMAGMGLQGSKITRIDHP